MPRTTVLLLFGGESSEHEVSIASARNVYAAMDDTKFEVILGFIDKTGKWWLLRDFGMSISTHDAPQLVPALGSGCFMTVPATHMVKPDVILPILHGKNGEDGTVQALAQLMHIPIVGCDMTASALCMDKLATKQIMQANNIQIVEYELHHSEDSSLSFTDLTSKLGSVLFVKPARSGSSVGVNRVTSAEQLEAALEDAHSHDVVALIERAIEGREIEVAVLGNPPHHRVSRPGEIKADGEFYSYDSKYASSSVSEVLIPAELPGVVEDRVRDLAKKAYSLVGCRGLSRIDFFVTDDNTIYLNEINTLPGFTNISMYPKLWREQGVSYPQLIEELITAALS